MSEVIPNPNDFREDGDDGSPTAEMPERPTPQDPKDETSESPAMKRRKGQPPKRRGLSKGDKVKLYIILASPLLFIVLVAGLFVVEVEPGVSMWDRFVLNMFGEGVPEESATGKAQLKRFIEKLDEATSSVDFYTRKMDELDDKMDGFKAGDMDGLGPVLDEAKANTKAASNVLESLRLMIKEVKNYEAAGKSVNPTSGDVQQAIDALELLGERSRKQEVAIDKKMWTRRKIPPANTNENVIKTHGAGSGKKEEEHKEEEAPKEPSKKEDGGGF